MGRQAEGYAEQLLQLIAHTEKGLRAGVGIIGPEHGGLLEIGHGVDPGIREHIQKDIPVMKLEGIEARLLHLLQALGRGQQLQLLDDLYLVHFHGDGFVFAKCNCRHCRAPPFKLFKIICRLQVASSIMRLKKAAFSVCFSLYPTTGGYRLLKVYIFISLLWKTKTPPMS